MSPSSRTCEVNGSIFPLTKPRFFRDSRYLGPTASSLNNLRRSAVSSAEASRSFKGRRAEERSAQ